MISIVIPAYNRIESLQRCVESMMPQVYEGLEIIVIDDFSKDSTKDYLLKLTAKHSFVKAHYNEKNYGVNYSRNRGIEMASNKFILFLDSDDELSNLAQIKNTLTAFPETKHFLFIVSDREKEFKNLTSVKPIQYRDWISGNVSGDFTHVVCAATMKKYLFFEQFKVFEHLNWLRVKKETSPQLMVPIMAAQRERDRSDSLTTSSRLLTTSGIRSKFEAEKLYYSMYYKDLRLYNPGSFSYPLVKTILLGVASDQKSDCRSLIPYASKMSIKLLSTLVMLIPSSVLKFSIIKFSSFKGRYLKNAS